MSAMNLLSDIKKKRLLLSGAFNSGAIGSLLMIALLSLVHHATMPLQQCEFGAGQDCQIQCAFFFTSGNTA